MDVDRRRRERERGKAYFNLGWMDIIISTNITYKTMSSPRSAPPSSDITRQHTPAGGDGSVASGDDGGDNNVEEQLPEKVCPQTTMH